MQERRVGNDRLGQGRQREDTAGIVPRREVGQDLDRLRAQQRAVAPEALDDEMPSGQVLAQREIRDRDPAQVAPQSDPRARLVRCRDRYGSQ